MKLKGWVPVATAFSLTACNAPVGKDIAECKMHARQTHASTTATDEFQIREFTNICMKAKGYIDLPQDKDVSDPTKKTGCSGSFEDPKCYASPSL